MPAATPATLITGTGTTWTRLGTNLTQFRDTAGFNPPSQAIGPNAVPNTVSQVPRLGGWDGDLRGLLGAADQDPIPPEVHAIINKGAVNADLSIAYLIKHNLPRRIEADAPACAPSTGIP